jgi:DNA-binding transcriptional ArsR family regulator
MSFFICLDCAQKGHRCFREKSKAVSEMIEKIVTSKTRVKLLKLFLTHIDNRYYLRELERLLNESLSPLRRQLIKLEKMGILVIEEEANLKYYRLNKNFTGMEELRRLVLGQENISIKQVFEAKPRTLAVRGLASNTNSTNSTTVVQGLALDKAKYDLLILLIVSLFVLGAVSFVVYTSTKNIAQVASLISEKTDQGSAMAFHKKAMATLPDEMVSKRWKVRLGNVPVFSSGETGGEKRGEEL